jgi:hypothetical protein
LAQSSRSWISSVTSGCGRRQSFPERPKWGAKLSLLVHPRPAINWRATFRMAQRACTSRALRRLNLSQARQQPAQAISKRCAHQILRQSHSAPRSCLIASLHGSWRKLHRQSFVGSGPRNGPSNNQPEKRSTRTIENGGEGGIRTPIRSPVHAIWHTQRPAKLSTSTALPDPTGLPSQRKRVCKPRSRRHDKVEAVTDERSGRSRP